MKHVIYHTEYMDAKGKLIREEDYDAYYNTIPTDFQCMERRAFNGCRLFSPTHPECPLTKDQLERLKAKRTGYELKYIGVFEVDDGNHAIYSIYERMIPDEESKAMYTACVEIGEENNGVSFAIDVIPADYDLSYDEHITRWDGIRCEGMDIFKTDDWIMFCESADENHDKHVTIVHGNWYIFGKWEKMIRKNRYITEYHCRNSLFPFVITFNTAPDDNIE